jgi:hypothetical protein
MSQETKPFKVYSFDKKCLCASTCGITDQGKRFSQLIDNRDYSIYFPVLCPHNNIILLLKHSEIEKMPHIEHNFKTIDNKDMLEKFRKLYRREIACNVAMLGTDNEQTMKSFEHVLSGIKNQLKDIEALIPKCNIR